MTRKKRSMKPKLSLDRGESQVMRLTQPSRDLQETVNASQDTEQFKDVGLAINEVSENFHVCPQTTITSLKQSHLAA